jgi:hypothetical protein
MLTTADPLTDRFSDELAQYDGARALGHVEPANLVVYYHAWFADQLLERLKTKFRGMVLIQWRRTAAFVWIERGWLQAMLEDEIGSLCETDFDKLLPKLPADHYWRVRLHDLLIQATPMRANFWCDGCDGSSGPSVFAECAAM